jgi:hypothetical protein
LSSEVREVSCYTLEHFGGVISLSVHVVLQLEIDEIEFTFQSCIDIFSFG